MKRTYLFAALTCLLASSIQAADPAITDIAKVDAQYAYIGEYTADTPNGPVGVRISTQAGDQPLFAKIYKGGLPGLGWKTEKPELATGTLDSQGITLRGTDGSARQVRSSGNRMLLVEASGQEIELKKIARHGVTLGKAARLVLRSCSTVATPLLGKMPKSLRTDCCGWVAKRLIPLLAVICMSSFALLTCRPAWDRSAATRYLFAEALRSPSARVLCTRRYRERMWRDLPSASPGYQYGLAAIGLAVLRYLPDASRLCRWKEGQRNRAYRDS